MRLVGSEEEECSIKTGRLGRIVELGGNWMSGKSEFNEKQKTGPQERPRRLSRRKTIQQTAL